MDHTEAGRILAERWNLPEEFRLVAGRHHDPCEGAEVDLLKIVHVSCRLADALGYDITHPLAPLDADAVLADLPVSTRERLQKPDEMRSRIEQRIRAYDGVEDSGDSTPEPPVPVAVPAEESEQDPPFLLDVSRQTAPPESIPRAVWIAVAVIAALVALSAVLMWKS